MSKYTIKNNPQIDQDIEYDLKYLVNAIDASGLEYSSIYLIGAFGRGEGTVKFFENRWRAVNDYDIVVIASDCTKLKLYLKRLGIELAELFQMDFVDIGCIQRDALPRLLPTMQNYDFKYGSMLLGGHDILHEIPNFKFGYLPPYEMVRLLCNRSAGLLTSILPEHAGSPGYLTNQLVKASIAIGDLTVYLLKGYHHSYQVRYETFDSIISKNNLPFELSIKAIDAVHKAYKAKLLGPCSFPFSIDESLMRFMIVKAYCAIASYCLNKTLNTVSEAETELRKYFRKNSLYRHFLMNGFRALRKTEIDCLDDIKNNVLFAQPFFYCNTETNHISWQYEYFRRFWFIPGALKLKWDLISAVRLWEKFHH
jgi:hypothetical protein